MKHSIKGLHHVTAIAGSAKDNLDFYTRILGLRLVKKTVNFDDPSTYHFYFGNGQGEPGTILTFFPWEGIATGRRGTGQATETSFSVPSNSFQFWMGRFEKENIIYNKPSKRFDEEYLVFTDPDGLKLEFVANDDDKRAPFITDSISENVAIKGFYNVTLSLKDYRKTAEILTDIFGYKKTREHVNRFRYETDAIETASIIDLVNLPDEKTGHVAGGSVHHIAFRVDSVEAQEEFRKELVKSGFNPTQQIDRDYFKSIYFREPGGVLFEIATDPPGFTVDETLEDLGSGLKLPSMYEGRRAEIEKALPRIK